MALAKQGQDAFKLVKVPGSHTRRCRGMGWQADHPSVWTGQYIKATVRQPRARAGKAVWLTDVSYVGVCVSWQCARR